MEILATIGLGLIGFFIGNLLFAKVGTWIATIYEIAKEQSEGSKGARLASAAFLSAGPWLLVATAIFAVYVHTESWAPPVFVGVAIAIVFFGVLTAYLARKAEPKREDAARTPVMK